MRCLDKRTLVAREDIVDKRLRINIIQWKPRRLNLHHHAMARPEGVANICQSNHASLRFTYISDARMADDIHTRPYLASRTQFALARSEQTASDARGSGGTCHGMARRGLAVGSRPSVLKGWAPVS